MIGDGSPSVAVICGGVAHERLVSVESGRAVWHALRQQGFACRVVEPVGPFFDTLVDGGTDVAYLALHGVGGEDGTVQAGLEAVGLPFVGSPSDACRRAWDKVTARGNMAALGVPSPRWVALGRDVMQSMGWDLLVSTLEARVGFPMVVKPATGGSAQGISVANGREDLHRAIPVALGYGSEVLFEQLVEGAEISVSVYGRGDAVSVLPPVQLDLPPADRFDYDVRHDASAVAYSVPRGLDDATVAELGRIATSVHVGLGLRDVSRTDFVVTGDQQVFALEVATSPGLFRASSVAAALQIADLSFGGWLADLVRGALADVPRPAPGDVPQPAPA